MGLYDNIGVGSSSNIYDTHAALPLDSIQKSDDILNSRYNEALAGEDTLTGTMRAAQGLFKNDKALLQNAKDSTTAESNSRMNSGDYEHMGRAVQLSARKFGNVYSQVNANSQGYQEYVQNMQDLQNSKNPNASIDPQKAKDAVAASLKRYGDGLQVDPTTGRFTNYFKGIIPAATYDVPGELLKNLKEMHPTEAIFQSATIGDMPTAVESDTDRHSNEDIKRTTLTSNKTLSQQRIYAAAHALLMQSPRLLADLQSRSDLHYGAQDRETNIAEFAPQYAQEEAGRQAQAYSDAHKGATKYDIQGAFNFGLKDAASKYQTMSQNKDFDPASALAARKYQSDIQQAGAVNAQILEQHETSTINSISGSKKDPTAADVDSRNPQTSVAANMALDSKATNYSELTALVDSSGKEVEGLQKDLAAAQAEQTAYESKDASVSKGKTDRKFDIKNLTEQLKDSKQNAEIYSNKKAEVEKEGNSLMTSEQRATVARIDKPVDMSFAGQMARSQAYTSGAEVASTPVTEYDPRHDLYDGVMKDRNANSTVTQNVITLSKAKEALLNKHADDHVGSLSSTKNIAAGPDWKANSEASIAQMASLNKGKTITGVGFHPSTGEPVYVWNAKGQDPKDKTMTSTHLFTNMSEVDRQQFMAENGITQGMMDAHKTIAKIDGVQGAITVGSQESGGSIRTLAHGMYRLASHTLNKTTGHIDTSTRTYDRAGILQAVANLNDDPNGKFR